MAPRMIVFVVIVYLLVGNIYAKFGDKLSQIKGKEFLRKTIVFDKMTQDVFYCPTEKPSTMNKLIVRYSTTLFRNEYCLIL